MNSFEVFVIDFCYPRKNPSLNFNFFLTFLQNLLQVCERIPTIGTQLKILSTVKATMLGAQGKKSFKNFSFAISFLAPVEKIDLFLAKC